MFKQTLYEKFTETSDPVKDMGIGMHEVWKKWHDEMGQRNEDDVYNEYYSHLKDRLPYHSIYILHNMLAAASKGEDHQKAFVKQCKSYSIGYESDFNERKEIAKVLDHEFGIKVDPRFNAVSLSLPLQEKFSEDSDPIHDMNIGWPEFLKYLDKKTDDIIKIDITKEFGEEIINQVSTEKGNLYVALGDGKKCSEKESKQYKDQLQNIFKASKVDEYLIFPGTKTTWNNYPVCFKWKIQPEYVKAFEILWMRPRPSFLDENVNEKFSEETDPIADMRIGLTKVLENAAKYIFDEDLKIHVDIDLDPESKGTINYIEILNDQFMIKYYINTFFDIDGNKNDNKFFDIHSKKINKEEYFIDLLKKAGVYDALETSTDIKRGKNSITWKIKDKYVIYFKDGHYDEMEYEEGNPEWYRKDFKSLNEKFSEISDPVKDMGIGSPAFFKFEYDRLNNIPYEELRWVFDISNYNINTHNIDDKDAEMAICLIALYTIKGLGDKETVPNAFHDSYKHWVNAMGRRHLPSPQYTKEITQQILNKKYNIDWESTNRVDEKFSEDNTDVVRDMGIGGFSFRQEFSKLIEKFKDPNDHYRLIKDILTDEGVKEYWVGLLTDWFVGKKISGIFSEGNADNWGGPHQLTSGSKIVRVESFYDNPMRNDYMAMLDFALVSIEPGYWRSAPDAEDADGNGYLKNPDEMWYYYSPDDNKRTGLSTKDKIFTHELTNEAFTDESDPIRDMGIGAMPKIWSKMADEVGHLNKVQFNNKYNLETEIDDAYLIYKILDKAGFRVSAQEAFDTVMAHWNTKEERIFIADVLSKHFQMDVDPKRETNESFTDESDPIKDMGIGLNYKTLTKGAIIKVNKSVFLSRKYGIIVGRGKGYSLKPGMYLLVVDVYKLPQGKRHIDLLTYSDLNWAEINRKDFDKLTQGMIHNLANTCKINIREDQFNDKFEIIERGF